MAVAAAAAMAAGNGGVLNPDDPFDDVLDLPPLPFPLRSFEALRFNSAVSLETYCHYGELELRVILLKYGAAMKRCRQRANPDCKTCDRMASLGLDDVQHYLFCGLLYINRYCTIKELPSIVMTSRTGGHQRARQRPQPWALA